MFCSECLGIYGYPDNAHSDKGLRMINEGQAVTFMNGQALCEMHWNNVSIIQEIHYL